MADYYHLPLMREWQMRPQTEGEVKSGQGDHSLATFVLTDLCRQIVDGRLVVGPELNGEDLCDFVWGIETIYRALAPQSVERSE
jgi:hypothetical protein